jgi:CubicO group peptidase (beta-lactamase class C family)
MKTSLPEVINSGVQQGLFTHADISVASRTSSKQHFNFDIAGTSHQYRPRVFDIASITKMIVTLLVYRLLTLKVHPEFSLDAPVKNFIPDMSGPFVDELTIRHLLTFHARFNRFITPEKMEQRSKRNPLSRPLMQMLYQIKKVGLEDKPGLKHNYANVHTILLGLVLESLFDKIEKEKPEEECKHGMKLDELIRAYITSPLGLVDTTTDPTSRLDRCVIAGHGLKLGQVSDPVARLALGQHRRLLGSAGLFSSSRDLVDILDLVILGENHPDCPISAEFIDLLHVPLLPTSDFGHGFGLWSMFRKNLEDLNPTLPPDGIFKSGYSGCIAMCSREFGVSFALTTNFLHKQRTVEEMRRDRVLLNRLYARIAECVFTF